MTLGELKADLRQYGIRAVGTLRATAPDSSGNQTVVVFFSSDQDIAFPFRLKNIYPLPMKSDSDDENVHTEKIKALKRSLIPEWRG